VKNIMRALFLAAAIAAPCLAVASDSLGTITVLEGQALIYRGSGRLHASEGVRVAAGDIVETAASTFAQVELSDRSVAQLGPATRVMLNTGAPRKKADPWLYVMNGWVKFSSVKRDAGAGAGYEVRGAWFEIDANQGVVVSFTTPTEINLFAEVGEIRVAERQAGAAAATPMAIKPGSFYQRKPPARGVVTSATAAAFVAEVPRPFRDSLPARLERFADRPVQPKEAPAFGYADVAPWLQAEPAVRRPLMQRWRGKAREPAFRAGLVANLSSHPEWDPILFPEKYKPKEPSRPPPPSDRAASVAP
jgi:hypothetical protein